MDLQEEIDSKKTLRSNSGFLGASKFNEFAAQKFAPKQISRAQSFPQTNLDIIIKSKIKSAVPDLQVAGEVPDALNKKVLKILEDASSRAKANGRRTLQARDL